MNPAAQKGQGPPPARAARVPAKDVPTARVSKPHQDEPGARVAPPLRARRGTRNRQGELEYRRETDLPWSNLGSAPCERKEQSPAHPMHHSKIAFCTCRRFSASSKTTDCGPSIISSVTSCPRW